MKTQEEIEKLASEKILSEQGQVGFALGYKECQEEVKPIMIKLFSLWESLAEAGGNVESKD